MKTGPYNKTPPGYQHKLAQPKYCESVTQAAKTLHFFPCHCALIPSTVGCRQETALPKMFQLATEPTFKDLAFVETFA